MVPYVNVVGFAPEVLSTVAPTAAEVVPVDVGPKLAPCPSGFDRVERKNDPQVNMPLINYCPQGGLGEVGMSSAPPVILDPTPSVLPMFSQSDDNFFFLVLVAFCLADFFADAQDADLAVSFFWTMYWANCCGCDFCMRLSVAADFLVAPYSYDAAKAGRGLIL
ncbi:hypothetical protein Nepgr_007796 [Nepenthes gracilis]|uniref:Uncharacterized protein n=1 Tax=Nepenthes gracilis TaxID=150966 RepID=A0AAD3XIV1_NEPGR|nr:hypothetical protein Nepgr_007796 [Nepenthes gracilis]